MNKFLSLSMVLIFFSTASYANASLNQIAVQALKESFNAPNGDHWEYGGIIVLRRGVLHWTNPPITTQEVDADTITPKELLLEGDILVAKYHTHPCLPVTHFPGYFSMPDIVYSIYFEVPEFILDECTGNVQEFDPHRDNPEAIAVDVPYTDMNTGERSSKRMVKGTIVGNIGQRGPDLDDE